MDEADSLPELGEEVFEVRPTATSTTVLWLAGGVAAFGVAAVGFVLTLLLQLDPISMHLVTTLPAIFGVGALLAGWTMARTPREVGVGAGGLRIQSRRGSHVYGWDQIGWST